MWQRVYFFCNITKYHETPFGKGVFLCNITKYHEIPYGCWCAGEVMTKLGIDGRKCHRRRLPVTINFSNLAVIINFYVIYMAVFINFYIIYLGSRHHKTIHTCKGFHSTYLCC